MGLEIYIDLVNRKELEEVTAKNNEISARNNKMRQQHGKDAKLEEMISAEMKQSFHFGKFSALAAWVENNVGDLENCEPVELTRAHIELLHNTLSNLTDNNCQTKLPACDEFFFGNQKPEERDWEDIENAKKMCQDILEQADWDKDMVQFFVWY